MTTNDASDGLSTSDESDDDESDGDGGPYRGEGGA